MTGTEDRAAEPKANILLVDDQPANLHALEAVLEDLGENLVKAQSGAEALRLLLQQDFAVILLDVQMRDLDGFETAKLIRGRDRSRHTPIIFLTAHDSPDFTPVKAYTLGAVDYLLKPLVPVILRAKVAGFVELFHKGERLRQLERREYERRLADEALRRSEEHFRLMADSAPVLLWLADPEARCTFVNRPWLEFTGRTLEQELGGGWAESVHPEDRPRWLEIYRTGARERRGFRREYRLRRADGEYRWMFGTATPRVASDGRFAGCVGSVIDISERRQAEEALRESRERLDLVLRSTRVGLWYCNLPFDRLEWNSRCKAHFGLPPDAAVTIDTFYECLHPDDRERTRAAIERSIAERVPYDVEYRTVAPDGQVRWVRALGQATYAADGRPLHFDGITVETTDRKELEEELRQRVEQLAAADRAKDEFLTMLAHELRNPLAPILTGLHVARQASDADMRDQVLAAAERQTRHLARLMDDLLDVSRITRGKVEIRGEVLDLARLVRTAAEDRRPVLEQHGLALAVEAPAAPVWVSGDPTRLVQVVNNLLDNAAKFTDPGGRVDVRLAVAGAPPEAVVTVRDTGIGIDPEMLPRLFDVFAQADRSLERTRGGLGLGLSVVKGLVTLHGGRVEAASAGPGRGAELTVRLPLARGLAAPAAPAPAAAPPGPRLRVVIVEDSPDSADSLRLLLEVQGHEVRVAHSGPEGVELALAWRPDIVVSDIGLPGLSGFEVARQLRGQPGLEKTLLVALTGYGGEEECRLGREAGFDHYLVKPADPADLRRVLTSRAG
jgi:PAS domain S-box-containing protein